MSAAGASEPATSGLGPAGAGERARLRGTRARGVDLRLTGLYDAAIAAVPDAAGRTSLVAVGGYGRGEMSPYSDVDVVLLHTPDVATSTVQRLAESLWYPLWDDGVPLDHAVRDTGTMRAVADRDWRAAVGMLDARHVAGVPELTLGVRSSVLGDWRRRARVRLPEVRAAWTERAAHAGELAYAAVPDLKESRGGLRDGVLLRALVATWLVDVPHRHVEECRNALLDVRDALHEAAGRRGDRLPSELLSDVAARVGSDPDALGRHVRGLGRRTAHLVDLTWRRVEDSLAHPAGRPARRAARLPVHRTARRPALEPLGGGLARIGGEVVLDRRVRLGDDPLLVLRGAAEAAERDLLLSPATAGRLATSAAQLSEPWSSAARRLLVRLLGAGPGLVPVWDELDHAGLVTRWLPEWDGVRLRASDSAVHRWTVDRHCVETCVEASQRQGAVHRPDLLLVAALLHDIGKGAGDGRDHGPTGARIAVRVARRWGFDGADAARIGLLVRHHLLLPVTALGRDPDDPAVVGEVATAVVDEDGLDLLAVLTECDARSTGPAAWSTWRGALVQRLAREVRVALDSGERAATSGEAGAPSTGRAAARRVHRRGPSPAERH